MDSTLNGQTAIVTGASSGIGRTLARALGRHGVRVCLVGRNREALDYLATDIGGGACALPADLSHAEDVERLVADLTARFADLHLLVHCAGMYETARFAAARIEDFDAMYAVNVRAPFRLTQALLPALIQAQGQVVFVNSTAGLRAAAGVAQYAATKHALKALAHSLREEVNAQGVRVISVYPGRTAGPLQERLFRIEGRAYDASRLLQQDDVAQAILAALSLPRTAEVTDLTIRPFQKV
ncbi:MAG: SDR family oxidoreductase [Anaerolineae bacterium]|nr:SDR family oxidoreductase [Anaerolineae bacterium]